MTAADSAELAMLAQAAGPPAAASGVTSSRVVEVDGIPMSALLAEAPRPRAVIVALHGGAVTSRYFDVPGWRSGPRALAEIAALFAASA